MRGTTDREARSGNDSTSLWNAGGLLARLVFTALMTAPLLASWGRAQGEPRIEIIAHRGASHDAPENTLPAVELAWKQGADAVEVDVHLTRDDQIAVIHDDSTKETTGLDRLVRELTVQELKTLDAGSWKGPEFQSTRIPTLEEVLKRIPDDKRVFIEIKCGPEILSALRRLIPQSGKRSDQIVFIAFSAETIRLVKLEFPQHQAYWLSSFEQDKATGEWSPTAEELIDTAIQTGVDGINIAAKPAWNGALVRQAKAAGLQVYVWTINDSAQAARALTAGVDGITTDRPGWLREQLSKQPQ